MVVDRSLLSRELTQPIPTVCEGLRSEGLKGLVDERLKELADEERREESAGDEILTGLSYERPTESGIKDSGTDISLTFRIFGREGLAHV